MGPVHLAAAQGEVLFDPDDLAPEHEARGLEGRGDGAREEARVPHIRDVAAEQRKGRTPIHPVIVGDAAHGGALARIHAVAPGRVVRDAVGRIGHQQPGDLSRQEVVHVRGIGGIAAEQAVPAQREEIAPHDVGGAGSDDRVLVGLPALGALAEEPFELLGGPEETKIEPIGLELLQDRGIPVEVEFPDPVVGQRQGPRPSDPRRGAGPVGGPRPAPGRPFRSRGSGCPAAGRPRRSCSRQ